jgi:hypothetical protein
MPNKYGYTTTGERDDSLRVSHNGHEFTATLDYYDGASDASAPACLIGSGKTEAEAIADLKDKLVDHYEAYLKPHDFSEYETYCSGCCNFDPIILGDGMNMCQRCWVAERVREDTGDKKFFYQLLD